MGRYDIPEDPALSTSSRLRYLWLHSVRGYTVLDVRHQPRPGWFGHMVWGETYRLMPRSVKPL